jgi:hypothetical protein
MQDYYSADPSADRISQVRSEISDVKSIMVNNIGEIERLHIAWLIWKGKKERKKKGCNVHLTFRSVASIQS